MNHRSHSFSPLLELFSDSSQNPEVSRGVSSKVHHLLHISSNGCCALPHLYQIKSSFLCPRMLYREEVRRERRPKVALRLLYTDFDSPNGRLHIASNFRGIYPMSLPLSNSRSMVVKQALRTRTVLLFGHGFHSQKFASTLSPSPHSVCTDSPQQ